MLAHYLSPKAIYLNTESDQPPTNKATRTTPVPTPPKTCFYPKHPRKSKDSCYQIHPSHSSGTTLSPFSYEKVTPR